MATAIAMPLSLVTDARNPSRYLIGTADRLQRSCFSRLVISVPFFFSGVAVCIALTRSPFPMGRVYFTDLAGASLGCLGAVLLLSLIDAPSAIFVIAAVLFVSAAAYGCLCGGSGDSPALAVWRGRDAGLRNRQRVDAAWSPADLVQRRHRPPSQHPRGEVESLSRRCGRLGAQIGPPLDVGTQPQNARPEVWKRLGCVSTTTPERRSTRFNGDLKTLDFLRYDVTSVGSATEEAAGRVPIIGVGGGRDVLNCAAQGFTRIVGIEVNSAMADLTSRRFESFSGFTKIPGFELHNDEGRSYLTRSGEHFDLIQASLVDTWAATSAGAMTLSENALVHRGRMEGLL